MSENSKLRFDLKSDQDPQPASGQPDIGAMPPDESGQAAEAESQMRKALGLLGEHPRHRTDPERMDQPGRSADRFSGGLHRRRFVQDGDVPVTVLRREPTHEPVPHRSVAAPTAPSTSRLQRTEAALAAETAARERAERALAEAQAATRDLQTKIGHAELARNEATEALQREREASAGLRSQLETLEARVQEVEARSEAAERLITEHQDLLADERHARKVAEKALRTAEAARDAAKQQVRTLTETPPVAPRHEPAPRRRVVDEPEVVAVTARKGRAPAVAEPEAEPEPVKWWLTPKPAPKRR